jgi:hypothetical protein
MKRKRKYRSEQERRRMKKAGLVFFREKTPYGWASGWRKL